jgi:hypothetical protein
VNHAPDEKERCPCHQEMQQRIPGQPGEHGYVLVGVYQTGDEYARSWIVAG